MTWQEYQDAVGELYEQIDGFGNVRRNITLPDKITGQPRQIDVWIEIEGKGHKMGIMVDAKFRKEKVDVKDVEEVLALADAVGANLSVLVALNGWTAPAEVKAKFVGLDLRLVTLEEALDLIVPDKWMMCTACDNDCIVADIQGGMIVDGLWSLLIAGQCRGCKAALVWCWACGDNVIVSAESDHECGCGHTWRNTSEGILINPYGTDEWAPLVEQYGSIEEFFLDIPEPEEQVEQDAGFYIRRGIILHNQEQNGQAIDCFNQAIKLSPQSALAHYHRAYTYDRAGSLEQAIQDYSKAIQFDPSLAMAFASRGAVFYSIENYIEAARDFRHFLTLMPDSPNRQTIQAAIIHAEREIYNSQKK